jgi:HPt (histidine-containing phosphotransfer) domain-containing protein
MKGDKESCLEAGMDGYLSKPLRANELLNTIRQTVGPAAAPPAETAPPVEATVVFDVDDALARVEGDRELLAELLEICRSEAPRMLDDIRRAIEADDPIRLERAAHAFKGSVASLGARAVAQAASELEAIGRRGRVSEARDRFAAMERDYQSLESAFLAFRVEVPA